MARLSSIRVTGSAVTDQEGGDRAGMIDGPPVAPRLTCGSGATRAASLFTPGNADRTVKARNIILSIARNEAGMQQGRNDPLIRPRKKRAGAARYRTRLAMLKGAVGGRLVPQDLMSAISRCTDLDQSAGSLRFRTTDGIEYFPRESRSRHLLGRSCQRTPPVHFSNAHLASRLAPSTLCFTRKVNDHRSVVRSDGRPEFSCGNVRTPRRFGGRSL